MSGISSKFELSKIGPGLEELKKALRAISAGQAYVVAGVTGKNATAARKGSVTNAQLAVIHEFGSPENQIPARPFILATFNKNRAEYQRMLQVAVKRGIVFGVARGFAGAGEYLRLLKLIGLKMASDMKAFVTQGAPIPPPNSPATLARKIAKGKGPAPALDEFGRLADPAADGAPRTLVDTGRLVGSITWELRGQGEDKS